MKKYLVFVSHLDSRGGKTEDFDSIGLAQCFVEKEKTKWDLVSIYRRIKEGEKKLHHICQYMYGKQMMLPNISQHTI